MGSRVLVLYTHWSEDYWEQSKEAPYPKRSYRELQEWDKLVNNCPLPALGVYTEGILKGKYVDHTHKEFVYLTVVGMRFDEETEQPYFRIEPLQKSSTPSEAFLKLYPTTGLFTVAETNRILEILKALNESPPKEWVELIEVEKPVISWRDYIGKYFLELIDRDLSDNEFENRCFQLLISLGFEVTQLGHKVIGEYPDGEAIMDDVVIVYDCKNIFGYAPNAEDKRKLAEYVRDAKLKYRDKNVYGVFVARSFEAVQTGDFFHFPVSSLVYLLYKKMVLGGKFALSPFRKILAKKERLDQTLIDNEWRI